MLELKKIGVTGSLATGKSLVCSLLKEQGAIVVNADEVVHQLLASDQNCIQKVIALLGKGIEREGQIDRSRVAEIVFSNPTKLLELEKIIHPLAFDQIERKYNELLKKGKHGLFVVEAPLLFEARWDLFFDTIIVVVAEKEFCKKRCLEKGITDYDKRVARLISKTDAVKRADFVIENNSNRIETLKNQTINILNKL